MEDSFNLAWKLAYVLQGKADKSLLKTYNDERQPAGEYVVKRTNENGRLNFNFYGMLGYLDGPESDRRMQTDDLLKEDSDAGSMMRDEFRKAISNLAEERHCVGAMMNQWYSSSALYLEDEVKEPDWPKTESERSSQLYTSTYPGWRLPHAWISARRDTPGPRPPLISTRDIVGHGDFTILTGIGGKALWGPAAREVSRMTGVSIFVVSIGWGQDYEDTFFHWHKMRCVGEKGGVLVRPDRTVAWRAQSLPGDVAATRAKLEIVLKTILGITGKRRDSKHDFGALSMPVMNPCASVEERFVPAEVLA
jgi:hypothetical protein